LKHQPLCLLLLLLLVLLAVHRRVYGGRPKPKPEWSVSLVSRGDFGAFTPSFAEFALKVQ
jgi:hypothetical protein